MMENAYVTEAEELLARVEEVRSITEHSDSDISADSECHFKSFRFLDTVPSGFHILTISCFSRAEINTRLCIAEIMNDYRKIVV